MFNIELHDQKSQPVLSIRKKTTIEELPKLIGENYGKIVSYLNELNEKPVDVPFTAYYNLDVNNLDVEMGFPVSKPLPGKEKDGIVYREIPAGKIVTATYKGAYSGMEKVYEGAFKWINTEDLEPLGVYYEYYYNSPKDVPESELLTKIVIPVK
ncbi:MAG: GyrI-like domain-containing protein [Solirubrobacterales bacterium]